MSKSLLIVVSVAGLLGAGALALASGGETASVAAPVATVYWRPDTRLESGAPRAQGEDTACVLRKIWISTSEGPRLHWRRLCAQG